MNPCRVTVVAVLAAALVSSAPEASATASPYSISDVAPAPAAGFRISDIDAAPTPGHRTPATSDDTPASPADTFKISGISPP